MTGWKRALREHEGTTRDAGLDSAARHISAALNEDMHLRMRMLHVTWAGCIIRRERRRLEEEQGAEPKVGRQPHGNLLWFGLRYLAIADSQTTHAACALRLSEQVLRQWWEDAQQ